MFVRTIGKHQHRKLKMKFLLVIVLALPATLGIDCTNFPDGNYEIGCKSYVICLDGQAQPVACGLGEVYDTTILRCNNQSLVAPPCGSNKNCSSLADGLYPDLDNNCHSYYTCFEGINLGHNFCAGVLVFNTVLDTCDWPDNTDPPCGTKGTIHTARHP